MENIPEIDEEDFLDDEKTHDNFEEALDRDIDELLGETCHRKAVVSSGYFSDSNWDTSFSEDDDDCFESRSIHEYQGLDSNNSADGAVNSCSSKLTPTLAIESFRASFILGEGDDQEVDLDAILGELCALESELKTHKSEINKSMKIAAPPGTEKRQKSTSSHANNHKEFESRSNDELDARMVGQTVAEPPSAGMRSRQGSGGHSGIDRRMSALDDALEQMTMLGLNMVQDERTPDAENAGVLQNDVQFSNLPVPPEFNSTELKSLRESSSHIDRDSAFMENESLRSSESFLSVNTTGSNHSSSSGAGGGGQWTSDYQSMENTVPFSATEEAHASLSAQLSTLEESLELEQLPPAEHAAKMKAEKIRIAMEKMKESNFRKLFVRAFSPDGSSKSILVDETMTVRKVWQILTDKNHWKPQINYSVIEQLPSLYMERVLEDHDSLVDVMLTWPKDTTNKILFTQRPEKYHVFEYPERFLLGESYSERGSSLNDSGRRKLLEEFFSTNQVPEVEGMLYIKAEGKKGWKKIYCVLRASGIYCNPKGKSKSLRDLTSLVQLDMVDIYTGIGWRKKYKAPTDYCFALKHPKIQKKAIKYIKYLCADDKQTFLQWITGIRIAKHGQRLYQNYKDLCTDVALWETSVLPSIGKLASDRLTMLCVATPPKAKTEVGRRGSLPSSTVHKVEQPQKTVQRRASVASHDVPDRKSSSPKIMSSSCARSMSFAQGDNRNSVCGGSSTDSSNSDGQGATISRNRKQSQVDHGDHVDSDIYSTLTRSTDRDNEPMYSSLNRKISGDPQDIYCTLTRRVERDNDSITYSTATLNRHSRTPSESNFSLRSSMRGGIRAKANIPVTTDVTKYLTIGRRNNTPPNEIDQDYSDYSNMSDFSTCDQSMYVMDSLQNRQFLAERLGRQGSPVPPSDLGDYNVMNVSQTVSDSSTVTPSPLNENISEDSGISCTMTGSSLPQNQQQVTPMVQTHSRQSSIGSQASSIRSRPPSGSSYSSGHSDPSSCGVRPPVPPPKPSVSPFVPNMTNIQRCPMPPPPTVLSSQGITRDESGLTSSVESDNQGLPFLSELVNRSSHSELGPKHILKPASSSSSRAPPYGVISPREHRRAASHGEVKSTVSNHTKAVHSTSDSHLASHAVPPVVSLMPRPGRPDTAPPPPPPPVVSPKPHTTRCKPPPPPRSTPVLESDFIQDICVQAPQPVRHHDEQYEGLFDIDSLPPPPPELLEGLPGHEYSSVIMPTPPMKKKPPPPPPKRRDSAQAKDYV